jgi:hypothetical protein
MPVLPGIPLAPRLYQASEGTATGKLAGGEGSDDPSRVDRKAPNITVSAANVPSRSTTSLAIEVNGRKVRALVDSGVSHNFIHPHLIIQGTRVHPGTKTASSAVNGAEFHIEENCTL